MNSTLTDADANSTPTTEAELRAAIASLKASTQTTEHRTKILNSQSALADRLRNSQGQIRARRIGHASHFKQRESAEVQHVKFANEQLLDNVRSDLQAQRDGSTKVIKAAPAIVTEVLNTDDRLLAELNDLSANHPQNSTDINSTRERVAKLIKALQHFRTQTIKDRLDRTYLESLARSNGDDATLDVPDASATDIQGDLGSLYGDIDDVVTMVASQEYAGGIERMLQDINQARERDTQSLNELIHGRLSSLTDRLDTLATDLESLQRQRTALEELSVRSRSFESESQAARNNHVLEAPEPPQDHFPALTALVEHLGCPQDPSINPYRHIERLATKLAHKADTNVEQILKLSQNSPEKTRTALRDVAAALASESSYASDLGVLERDIDAARIDLEQLST